MAYISHAPGDLHKLNPGTHKHVTNTHTRALNILLPSKKCERPILLQALIKHLRVVAADPAMPRSPLIRLAFAMKSPFLLVQLVVRSDCHGDMHRKKTASIEWNLPEAFEGSRVEYESSLS